MIYRTHYPHIEMQTHNSVSFYCLFYYINKTITHINITHICDTTNTIHCDHLHLYNRITLYNTHNHILYTHTYILHNYILIAFTHALSYELIALLFTVSICFYFLLNPLYIFLPCTTLYMSNSHIVNMRGSFTL